MFSSATQPPRHNFVVSAITFEGFKLRSSNLTHALFIQISRTSSITDIVVQSKMAAGGHFVKKFQQQKKVAYLSEMARTVIESYFRTSKMAAGGHFVPKLKKKTLPHLFQFPPTFHYFSTLLATFHHVFPLFPTFPTFPVFTMFSLLFPTFPKLFTNISHFSLLCPTYPHEITNFIHFSSLLAT